LPWSYAIEGPDNWYALSAEERATRAQINDDQCIIDDKEFYLRGCLEIPVIDHPDDPFVWLVWVSVSAESFQYTSDRWTDEIGPDEAPRFGWLSNQIHGYPLPADGVKCHVHLRSGDLRSTIELEPTNYSLAVEQREGITLERIQEIAAMAMGH